MLSHIHKGFCFIIQPKKYAFGVNHNVDDKSAKTQTNITGLKWYLITSNEHET